MSSFRETLVLDVGSTCDRLFERHLVRLRPQERISDVARNNVGHLLWHVDCIKRLDPFPARDTVDTTALESLREEIDAAEDVADVQEKILAWLRGVHAAETPEKGDETETVLTTLPLNERMLEHLRDLTRALRRNRSRLPGNYEEDAYREARNDYTYHREIYAQKLNRDLVETTDEDANDMEQDVLPTMKSSTDDTFVANIRAATEFIRARALTIV